MLAFFGIFCWCIVLTSNMTIGLDQDLSVPLDSYVLTYFDYQEAYLGVGVPVYFVTKGLWKFVRKSCQCFYSNIKHELFNVFCARLDKICLREISLTNLLVINLQQFLQYMNLFKLCNFDKSKKKLEFCTRQFLIHNKKYLH